jgi:hypothetical protein
LITRSCAMATPNVATAATANRDLTNKRFIKSLHEL